MKSNLPPQKSMSVSDDVSSAHEGGESNISYTNGSVAPDNLRSRAESGARSAINGAPGGQNLNQLFTPPPSLDDDETIDWREMFSVLRRRRRIIAVTFLSVVALGLLVTKLTNPIYQATASLEIVIPQQAGANASELPGLSNIFGDKQERSQTTQIALLQGPGVTGAAKKKIAASNPDWGKSLDTLSGVNVQPLPNTDIIQVSVRSHDPNAAKAYAQQICREYIIQSGQQNREGITNATAYINNRLKVVRGDLDRARGNLRDFQKKNGIVDLEAEAGARSQSLIQTQDAIRTFEAQRLADQAQLAALRSLISRSSATNTVPVGIQRNSVVEDMKKSLTALELERVRLSQEYTPQSEEIRSLDRQISAIRQRMAREAQTQVSGWTIEKDPVHLGQTQAAATLQTQIWANDSKLRAMKSALEQQRGELAKVPAQQYQLQRFMMDMETLHQTHKVLGEKALNLRLQKESSVVTGRLIPGTNFSKVSPRPGINLLTSIILGLVLAAALAALVDRVDDRVHTRQDAEACSGLPVLAQIPYVHDKAAQSLLNTSGETSVLLESYRMLRTNIEFSSLGQPLRSLVLTSTQPNEGKSTTAVDLAIAMALDDKKVILVDADLRRPTLHELLDLPNRVGFTSVVAQTATLEEALQATSVPGLFLLASGPAPPNPTELLNSRSARAVWSEIIGLCDLALIDTPPALVMADAQIVTSLMDAVVMVISMQEAGRRAIERTSTLLARTGTPVLGAILTKARVENNEYYDSTRYYGAYVKK